MILYMYIALGQGQKIPWGQTFDVNRKPISYPEWSLYFSFHCDTNKQKKKQKNKHANNAKSISLETNSGASGSCLKHR